MTTADERELENLRAHLRRLGEVAPEDRPAMGLVIRRSARIVAATQRGRTRQNARLLAQALGQDGVEHQDRSDGRAHRRTVPGRAPPVSRNREQGGAAWVKRLVAAALF